MQSTEPRRAATAMRAGRDFVRIAVDAMGADFEPALAVEAACRALHGDPDLRIVMIGDRERIDPVSVPDRLVERIERVHCADSVAMDAKPAEALRRGRDSSMSRALAFAAGRSVEAVVSCGNTGALMVLARARLGMLPGIERPALMTEIPVRGGSTRVLDLGANIGVDAARLAEFALLGSAAAAALLGRSPRVALLNIGSESTKGPDVLREAARRCRGHDIDFHGFVEGHAVFEGAVDVVVCDGFAGNILLKSAEGAISMLLDVVDREARGWRSGRRLKHLRDRLHRDYEPSRHNGASLLGVDGIVIKSHAHAPVEGVAHAIGVAATEVRRGMLPELKRQLWASV
jgi:glycerol-3-phosphate acyltransferase PlsX